MYLVSVCSYSYKLVFLVQASWHVLFLIVASAYVKIKCHILFSKSRFTWSLFCWVNLASWSSLLFACDFLYFSYAHCTLHLVTSRCSYHWLVFHSFKLRDGPLFFWEGGGQFPKKNSSMAKTAEQNNTKGAMRKNIEQVLSTIIILVFDVKKNSLTSYCPAILSSKVMHNLNVRKTFYASEKLPTDSHWAVWSLLQTTAYM